jgi:hypothetical protein
VKEFHKNTDKASLCPDDIGDDIGYRRIGKLLHLTTRHCIFCPTQDKASFT